jgi:hypothetical protein
MILLQDECRYTSLKVEGFAGLKVCNGPYGAFSSQDPSDGNVHFRCEKEIDEDSFLYCVRWIQENSSSIIEKSLSSMIDQYEEMKEIIQEDYDSNDGLYKIRYSHY